MFEAALQCNIDCTNHMEGVELYTLGAMDVVCQFCGAIGFKSEKRNGQVSLENYALMEIRLIQETY